MEDATRYAAALRQVVADEMPAQLVTLDAVSSNVLYKTIQDLDIRGFKPDFDRSQGFGIEGINLGDIPEFITIGLALYRAWREIHRNIKADRLANKSVDLPNAWSEQLAKHGLPANQAARIVSNSGAALSKYLDDE